MMYKRVFVPNPSFRFNPSELGNLAAEIVYVCDMPMFDNLAGLDNVDKFEGRVAERLANFDPQKDIVAYYGDSMIFAMMIMYLADNFDAFDMARFSSKKQEYIVRRLSYDHF